MARVQVEQKVRLQQQIGALQKRLLQTQITELQNNVLIGGKRIEEAVASHFALAGLTLAARAGMPTAGAPFVAQCAARHAAATISPMASELVASIAHLVTGRISETLSID